MDLVTPLKCDFSLRHYREIIELAKELGYSIGRLKDWCEPGKRAYGFNPDGIKNDGRVLLIRHDVDFSLQYAHEMALVEIQEGIKSTYHIMLQSEFYNALTPENKQIIRYISDLGHEIGYHFNSKEMIMGEDKLLQTITHKDVESYSRHFPLVTPRIQLHRGRDAMGIKIKYLSDSCRNFREGCLCSNLGKYDKIQFLCHPIWWVTDTNTREEAIEYVRHQIKFNTDSHLQQFYDQVPEYLSTANNIST